MEWQKFHSVEVDGANFCVKYCVLKKYYDLMNFENSHIKTVNYTPGGIKLLPSSYNRKCGLLFSITL